MKWGRQAFLNPASSEDSGWYKFSIRPRRSGRTKASLKNLGHSITFQIADCSNKIYLDMDWSGLYYAHLKDEELHTVSLSHVDEGLEDIKERRVKVRKFAEAIRQAAEKIEEALDLDEKEVLAFREKVVEAKERQEKQ